MRLCILFSRRVLAPLLFIFAFQIPPAHAKSGLENAFQKAIGKSGISKSDLSLYAADGNRVLVALNENEMRVPASISKLPTAYSALRHFPPGTQFTTSLASNGKIAGTQLTGDLFLIGGGDPSFTSETLWVLVNHFVRTGIRDVSGDLMVDDTLFSQQRFDDSRSNVRVQRAYDAPTGAMSFNWNSVNIYIRPSTVGKPATVMLDPENDFTELKNEVITSSGKSKIDIERKIKGDKETFTVSGSISSGDKEIVKYSSITQPDLWSGEQLRQFLKQRGIRVSGKVRTGQAPPGIPVLAETKSKPIELIVADMNKFSNNYVAEMLALHLGTLNQRPGTIEQGMKKIEQDLLELGLKKADFSLTNPSGLNRENRISAKGLFLVLQKIQSDFSLFPEFLASLPIAGVDGTLRSRLKSNQRTVRAKTGMLTGVSSLAGFVARAHSEPVPFVFIANGNSDAAKARELFDQLTRLISQEAAP